MKTNKIGDAGAAESKQVGAAMKAAIGTAAVAAPIPVTGMSRDNTHAVEAGKRFSSIDAKVFEMGPLAMSPNAASLAWIPGIACLPLTLFGSWYIVQPRKEAVVMHCGEITKKLDSEGCHFVNVFFREIREIETSQISYDMKNQKITDLNGNPVLVSAILTYRFTDPVSALFNVHDPKAFVTTQASAVLKEVVGSFSYDQLKEETDEICERSVSILQERVNVAGAKILSVNLNELNYAQEIAASMLKKQQAQALIEARELLVQGAVDISQRMIQSLEQEKVNFSDEAKSKLVTDLIIMSIGENNHSDR